MQGDRERKAQGGERACTTKTGGSGEGAGEPWRRARDPLRIADAEERGAWWLAAQLRSG